MGAEMIRHAVNRVACSCWVEKFVGVRAVSCPKQGAGSRIVGPTASEPQGDMPNRHRVGGVVLATEKERAQHTQ
eukprot:2265144-Rhodomonas_salina.2